MNAGDTPHPQPVFFAAEVGASATPATLLSGTLATGASGMPNCAASVGNIGPQVSCSGVPAGHSSTPASWARRNTGLQLWPSLLSPIAKRSGWKLKPQPKTFPSDRCAAHASSGLCAGGAKVSPPSSER